MRGLDLAANRDWIVFVGDRPNDAPMSGYFPHSRAVANITVFAGGQVAAQVANAQVNCSVLRMPLVG